MKIPIIHSQPQLAIQFQALKSLCTKNLNFTIRFGFGIIQFTIQEMKEMVFRLSKVGGKSQEGKQLKFSPQFNKCQVETLTFKNLMF